MPATTTSPGGSPTSPGAADPEAPPPARDPSRGDVGTIARGGALNLAGAVLSGALTFAFFIVLGRGLEPAGYGAFVSAMGLFTILSRTAELGADTGLTRTLARYRALDRHADLRTTLVVGLIPVAVASTAFGFALWFFAAPLAEVFGKGKGSGQIDDYARVMALFLPASSLVMVLLAATRGLGQQVPTNLIDKVGRSALQPVLAVVVLALGLSTTAIALAFAAPIALACAVSAVWAYRLLGRAERADPGLHDPRPWRHLASRFWRFTAPRGVAGIFQIVILWVNTLILGGIGSTTDAGIFNAATRFVTAGLMAGVAVQQVMGPQVSRLLANNEFGRAGVVYQTATKWLVTLSWPLYLTLATFSPTVLRVFGSEYSGGEASLVVLGLTMLVATGVGTVDVILLMGGRSSWNLADTAAALTVGVVLNFVLIPPFGVTGAALAWAASILTRNLASLVQVWLFMRLHPFGTGFSHAAVPALVCYGAGGLGFRLAFGTGVGAFIAYQVIAGAAYLALLARHRHELELPVLWAELRRGRRGRRGRQPVG